MAARIIVIGIGHGLRGDDAAGVQAVRLWQESHPETASRKDLHVELLELPGLNLLDHLKGVPAAVLVDAVRSQEPPGTVRLFTLHELLSFPPATLSAHGWGVAEALRLGRSIDPLLERCKLVLIGLTGKNFETGGDLSPEVRHSLPRTVELLQQNVIRLLEDT